MDFLHNLVLLLHFVGFAALFGGAFVQLKSNPRQVNAAMFHGALTQLVTGLLLVGFLEMGDESVNHVKVAVKLVLLLAVGALVLTQRKKDSLANPVFFSILGLTLITAAVAVFV